MINFIEIDNFKIGYKIEGQGIPALVVGSAIYYPRTFSQNLRKHLQLIFIDHRGFTTNRSTDTKYFELEQLLADIESVRKALNLDKFIIIGHSGHGYLALEYAKKYPDQILQVVLIAMGPDQSGKSHQLAEQYFNDVVCPDRKEFLAAELVKLQQELKVEPERRFINFCIRLGARSWYDFKFDASSLWRDVQVNNVMFDYVWGVVFRDLDITKGLNKFDKPVFLALGQFDFLVAPFFAWNEMRSQFKNLRFKVFAKSGHTPQLEEPEQFDIELLEFLNL
jgi:proline iminopeptidase